MGKKLRFNQIRAKNEYTVLYTRMKAIYCFDDFFVGYRRGRLYRCSLIKYDITPICKIPLKKYQIVGSKNRIVERALHINPRGAICLSEDIILLPVKGIIYRIHISTGEIAIEHHFRSGMNAPLELFKVVGIDGFEDCIIYGEYLNNLTPHEISIYSRALQIDSQWEKRFTFSKGSVQHIHAFAYGRDKQSLIIMTGDKPSESGIWRITRNFENIEKICLGSEEYRACIAMETHQGIVYATDNPFNRNHMYLINACGEKSELCDLEGSVINGKLCDNELYFSTTIECIPFIYNWQVVVPLKRSKANADNVVRIKKYMENNGLEEVAVFYKDMWYMPLFQFGMVEFCPGESNVVLCTPIAVKRYDNVVLRLK